MSQANPYYISSKNWLWRKWDELLHWVHEHERGWNAVEIVLIIIIAILHFRDREIASEKLGWVLHIVTFIILFMSLVFFWSRWLWNRFGDPYGVHNLNGHRINTRLGDREIYFIVDGNKQCFDAFVNLCHDAVQDRDTGFNVEKRSKLYRRWLAGNPHSLLCCHNKQDVKEILAGSIILPVTDAAFQKYVHVTGNEQLDAIDIGTEHLLDQNKARGCNYLLIDIAALNSRLTGFDRARHHGIAINLVIRHLGHFFAVISNSTPTLLFSSSNSKLVNHVMKSYGFVKLGKQCDSAQTPIYGLDLATVSTRSGHQQKMIKRILLTISKYGVVNNRES